MVRVVQSVGRPTLCDVVFFHAKTVLIRQAVLIEHQRVIDTDTAYNIPMSNSHCRLYSFLPRTVREWNVLPQEVAQLRTVESSKYAILSI